MKYFMILALLSLPAQAQIVNNAAQSQGVEFNGVKQKSVVGARAYVPVATSDCMGSSGAGGQGQFFGFSFSSTTQSKPCNIREDTKIAMWVLGDEKLAREIFMQGDYAKIAAKQNNVIIYDKCQYPTDECKRKRRFK